MGKATVHLICNAHLDPVWLWEIEEGVAETLSTFRTAADLCEQFGEFVFNHNEAILYEWVEQHDPALFRRIRRLVKKGQWNIMGGWWLQPDCNMPSGESLVRQILLGKRYFAEKFGVELKTAINFDPFGHSRGLVQILAKSGYDSYLFGRPDPSFLELPHHAFVWEGYDGSEVTGARFLGWYNSIMGRSREKVETWLAENKIEDANAILWGVGNHGGGPSRHDIRQLKQLMRKRKDVEILHSTPRAYFAQLKQQCGELPHWQRDLNPWAVGCYTSMIRIKQKHRQLENGLYSVEKMAAAAAGQGLMAYPKAEFQEVMKDLATIEFHDIMPGSSIEPVEEWTLQLAGHGLEILTRVKMRAFIALSRGQKKAGPEEYPILVYNPHPFAVDATVVCEFNMPVQMTRYQTVRVFCGQEELPSQVEKEHANLPLEWRKRVAFKAKLKPGQMNRFRCYTQDARKAKPKLKARNGKIRFKTKHMEVVINTRTGLVDRYRVKGVDMAAAKTFEPLVIADNADPWEMVATSFPKVIGRFKLLRRAKGAEISGLPDKKTDSVRVIEDGPVRSVAEAVLGYGDSFICQRYLLSKHDAEIGLETRVFWAEKDKMLKLSVPTVLREGHYVGQVAYGTGELPEDGTEAVSQKWSAVVSKRDGTALTCINDGTYGSDYTPQNGLRLTLLRSPAYSGHAMDDNLDLIEGQFIPRIDQGERKFQFWLKAGALRERMNAVDREALAKNEKPFALNYFPAGGGVKPKPLALLSDKAVQIGALKQAEDGKHWIVRLFEPTGRKRKTILRLPLWRMRIPVQLRGFEIKTLKVNPRRKSWRQVDLLERG